MKSYAKAALEIVAVVTVVAILLLLVATEYPEPSEKRAPPSPQEITLFKSKCEGRTTLIRNKLNCVK